MSKSVSVPRPEHPRMQCRRDTWLNLNGEWQFSVLSITAAPSMSTALSSGNTKAAICRFALIFQMLSRGAAIENL